MCPKHTTFVLTRQITLMFLCFLLSLVSFFFNFKHICPCCSFTLIRKSGYKDRKKCHRWSNTQQFYFLILDTRTTRWTAGGSPKQLKSQLTWPEQGHWIDQRSSSDNRVSDMDMKYIREHKNTVWPRVMSSYALMRRHRGKKCQIKKKSIWRV